MPRQRRTRGEIHIEDGLLRFTYEGTRYKLYASQDRLREAAIDIKADIALNRFDPTMDRYRAFYGRRERVKRETVSEIFQAFMRERESEVKRKTFKDTYVYVQGKLDKCPHQNPRDAEKLYRWVRETQTDHVARRVLMTLSKAFRRCSPDGENPYEGMYKRFKVESSHEVRVFSENEKLNFLSKVEAHHGIEILHFTQFLFLTGCRPSEAVGLRKVNALSSHAGYLYFCESIVESGKEKIHEGSSKNGRKRFFPLTDEILKTYEHENSSDLMFTRDGEIIPMNWYRNHVWNKYAPKDTIPYNARDTFITQQILKGSNIAQVAIWVDNSIQTIERHYLDRLGLGGAKPL